MMTPTMYLKNVATLTLNEAECTGCGMCLEVCPHSVFARNNGRIGIVLRDACMECGACARNCPVGAITVQAGVGCAMAVINTALGRGASSCCCVIESPEPNSCGCGGTETPRTTSC